ncbi:ABC transporter transmembrane domain-containing protein [Blastococcus sp. SYSU D00669]
MAEAPTTGGRLLLRALRRHRGRLALSVLLLSLWQLCEALVPVFIGVVVDRAVAGADVGALLRWLGGLAVLFVVLSLAYRFGARTTVRAMQEEMHDLRMEVADRVLHPRGVRTELLPGETLSLATSDAESVGNVLHQVSFTVASLVSLVTGAVVLVRADVVVGLVVLGGVPAVVAATLLLAPRIERRSGEHQAAVARATGVATDLVRGLRPLKGIGAEDAAAARFRTESRRARTASIAMARSVGALSGLSVALGGLLLAAVALLAGRAALAGDIGTGELIAIVGLAAFLSGPIQWLGELGAQAATSRASAGRIAAFLAGPPLVAAGSRTDAADPPELALELAGSVVTARPGELLAVVVDDPALTRDLVARLGGEDGGGVVLGGVPLGELSTAAARERLLVTDTRIDLFEGTLRSAVDPRSRLADDELARVLGHSAATDVVALHPAGLEQPVAVDGAAWSGGQRQRIALARALATGTPVLVMAEPTSAVDAVTEQRIAEGLRAVRHGAGARCTTVLLTGSPALLAQASRVLFVAGGQVREGRHADLLHDPAYRALVAR